MRRTAASFLTVLCAASLIVPLAAPAFAVVAAKPDTTAGTNGTVYAVLQVGGRIYLGGKFSWAGPLTGNGAAVNGTDGLRLNTSARPNGVVRATAAGPNGSWYAGGDFTKIGKSNRPGAAKISSSGSLASGWNPRVVGSVHAIAVAGDVVYLGGSFSSVGGSTRANLAAVDASGALLPWNPGANGQVGSLAISPDGGTVYVGGHFTKFTTQNVERRRIGAVRAADASVVDWNPRTNSFYGPWAMQVVDGGLLVGGDFTSAGGQQQPYFARFSGTP